MQYTRVPSYVFAYISTIIQKTMMENVGKWNDDCCEQRPEQICELLFELWILIYVCIGHMRQWIKYEQIERKVEINQSIHSIRCVIRTIHTVNKVTSHPIHQIRNGTHHIRLLNTKCQISLAISAISRQSSVVSKTLIHLQIQCWY